MANVHYFNSTATAYDESQCRDDIKSGDILVAGFTVGILMGAWPVAVKGPAGHFHSMAEGSKLEEIDGGKWAESYKQAMAFDNSKGHIKVYELGEAYTQDEAEALHEALEQFFKDRRAAGKFLGSEEDENERRQNRIAHERLLALKTLLGKWEN